MSETQRISRALLLTLTAALLSGCAGMSEQACVTADWRTIGFEDGTRGQAVGRIGTYRQSCSKYGVAPELDSYRAGHDEGVEIYCRASNGFETGHSGATYQGVCPSSMESDFLSAYNSGRQLFELESALRQIDSRIASNERGKQNIKQELVDIAATIAADGTSAEERVRLVAAAADLGSKHSQLEAENVVLREDRIVVALDLEDYRQQLAANF